MPSGRVRWFDANKGYGFIQNEQGADVFLPAAALPEGVKTLIWPPLWRILSSCWIPRGTSCAATIIHLRLKARNWPR